MKANREVIADLAADVSVPLNYNAVFDTWQAMIPRNAIIVSEGANSNTADIESTTPVHLEQWVWVGLLLYIPKTQILKKGEFALKAVQPWSLEMETIVRYKLTTILVVVNNNDGIYSGLDSIH